MIIKRTRGVHAGKALAYDYGPGKADEHHNPRRVAGTVPGRDWRARASAMQAKIRADGDHVPGKRGRVIRLAVAAAPQDRVLGDREWAAIAHRVVHEFSGDAEGYAWEAVRHDKSHIHITLLARGHDGRLVSESNDYRRYGRISDGIERDYQLARIARGPGRPKPDRAAARAAVERQRAKTVAPIAERSTTEPPPAAPRRAPGRDRAEPQRPGPPGAGGDSRPNLGWQSPRVARQLGPQPPDWGRWPERQQREWIRARMAEYQRQQRERGECNRDNGRER